MWARRLVDGESSINKEAVLVSSIFHDVGYAISLDGSKHAEDSALICEKYLHDNGFDAGFIEFVSYLVKNHSNKFLMTSDDIPLELILLMEADLLTKPVRCLFYGIVWRKAVSSTSHMKHHINALLTIHGNQYR